MQKKIILFYRYVELEDPESMRSLLMDLGKQLGLKGRIILGHEGINGTLCGTVEAIDAYCKASEAMPEFAGIDYKTSEARSDGDYFPRLRVVVKEEIVNMGVNPREITVKDTGVHLTPEQFHQELMHNRDSFVLLDTRNDYESAVGRFTDAITPAIKTFREYPAYIEENKELFEGKKVLMYCTGGVRCERASAYLVAKGITKEVYQLEGGIHRYAEQFPDGFFRGKNYVFDDRGAVRINADVLSNCAMCAESCDTYTNCMNASCNKHFICCVSCKQKLEQTCSESCKQLVRDGLVPVRPSVRYIVETACEI